MGDCDPWEVFNSFMFIKQLCVQSCCVLYHPDAEHHLQGTMFRSLSVHGIREQFSSPWHEYVDLEQVVHQVTAMILQFKPPLILTCASLWARNSVEGNLLLSLSTTQLSWMW